MPQITVQTPLGPASITERDGAIIALDWGAAAGRDDESPLLAAAAEQLAAYFAGELRRFDLPLRPAGTAFQQAVWQAMRRIPYGQVASYGDVAHEVDSAPRAVGGACACNPIAVLIPCHRVVGSGRHLGGYSGSGGPETKRALLALEGVTLL